MPPEAEAEHRRRSLAPKNPAYLNNLGFSLFLRQRFKEAIKSYESAASLAPMSPRVRTNLGFAYAATGDLRRAAREFQMGGTEAEAKNNLGFAYERRGDMANAYDLYVEALRLDPKAARARSNLVHAAVVLGRPIPPEAVAPAPAAANGGGDVAAEPSGTVVPSEAPSRRRTRDPGEAMVSVVGVRGVGDRAGGVRPRAPQQQLRAVVHGVVHGAAREVEAGQRGGGAQDHREPRRAGGRVGLEELPQGGGAR
jgi:hypothetical protein